MIARIRRTSFFQDSKPTLTRRRSIGNKAYYRHSLGSIVVCAVRLAGIHGEPVLLQGSLFSLFSQVIMSAGPLQVLTALAHSLAVSEFSIGGMNRELRPTARDDVGTCHWCAWSSIVRECFQP